MRLFQAEGHASKCYSSPNVWVALGTAVVDLLWTRRPTQGTGSGSSCGLLVGSQFHQPSDVTQSYRLKGNVSVTYLTLVP